MRKSMPILMFGLLLLLGGAVINTAVAWWCALRHDNRSFNLEMKLGRSLNGDCYAEWNVNLLRWRGTTHVLSQAFGTELPMDLESAAPASHHHVQRMSAEDALPAWCAWMQPTSVLGPTDWFSQYAIAHGWPLRSLMHSHNDIDPHDQRGLSAWRVEGIPHWLRGYPAAVRGNARWVSFPLQPIWSGFIINTVVYATLLWLIFLTLLVARRVLRRKRGLCEQCAYPIGSSSVCTECGAAITD